MACCKADEYGGWCKEMPTPTVGGGAGYCVFHAPKSYKSESVEEFNDRVFDQIQKAIDLGTECNLSGTIFPGQISFEPFAENQLFPPVDFSGATFSSEVSFKGIIFSGKIIFVKCEFNGNSVFARNIFVDDTRFSLCTFNGQVDFTSNVFYANCSFNSCTFKAQMLCDYCTFDGSSAQFNSSKFKDRMRFWGNNFSGTVNFRGSTFERRASFLGTPNHESTFSGETIFNQCKFKDEVSFWNITFNSTVGFSGSTFSGNTKFERNIFHGHAYFREIICGNELLFDHTVFEEKTVFTKLRLNDAKVFFKDIDFKGSSTTFLETDLAGIHFDRCRWPQKKVLGLAQLGSSDVLYDEEEADKNFWQASIKSKILNYSEFSKSYGMVEDLYRQLKQQYKERHNEAEVSK